MTQLTPTLNYYESTLPVSNVTIEPHVSQILQYDENAGVLLDNVEAPALLK